MATTTNKQPTDYLNDIKSMKAKMSKVMKGDLTGGIITGAAIGVVAGIGFSLFKKSGFIKYGMIGGMVGAVISGVFITVKNKKANE